MNDVLLSPIRLNELETLIQNSVERAISALKYKITDTTEQAEQNFTVSQAADYLNLAVPTIYSMVSRGELPYMKRSKRLYFSRLELSNYLKEGRKKTVAETVSDARQYLVTKKIKC